VLKHIKTICPNYIRDFRNTNSHYCKFI